MKATRSRSDTTVRLRVAVFDALTRDKGAANNDEAAALLGIDRATLYRLKRGDGTPQLDTAMGIADRLGVRVDDLFERVAS